MSVLYLVLVTLHGQFTIDIEQDKIVELVTLNTIFSVVFNRRAQLAFT